MSEELYGFAAKVAREALEGLAERRPPEGVRQELQRAEANIDGMDEQLREHEAEIAALTARLAELGAAPQDRAAPVQVTPAAAPQAAWSLDSAGTPAQTGVPADFGAAQEAALVNSGQLTVEEIAEFRALRAEKKVRDAQAAAEAAAAAARLQRPSHHVHLADGSVVQGSAIATHYSAPDGSVLVVTGVYEMVPVPLT
jgi:hypothetical protein